MTALSIPANLAFDSYSELVAALGDWMDRSDLTGTAQQMIALAEAKMRRELVPLFLEKSDSVVTTDGVGVLPDDCGTITRVIDGTNVLYQLGARAAPANWTSGTAVAYTLEGTSIRLWPASDTTLTVLYQPELTALSEGSPTNALLSGHPDLYFYGAMMFAEGYVANDNRAGLFKGLWDEALAGAVRYFTRQRFAGPLVPRVGFVP